MYIGPKKEPTHSYPLWHFALAVRRCAEEYAHNTRAKMDGLSMATQRKEGYHASVHLNWTNAAVLVIPKSHCRMPSRLVDRNAVLVTREVWDIITWILMLAQPHLETNVPDMVGRILPFTAGGGMNTCSDCIEKAQPHTVEEYYINVNKTTTISNEQPHFTWKVQW